MRNLLHDVRHDQHGLILHVEVKDRGVQKTVYVTVPWKYLLYDELMQRLQDERARRHRPWNDPTRPYLPLEVWE